MGSAHLVFAVGAIENVVNEEKEEENSRLSSKAHCEIFTDLKRRKRRTAASAPRHIGKFLQIYFCHNQ